MTDVIDPLKEDVKEILNLVEKQNGRVRDLEKEVAVLKDRQPERPTRAGALAGSVAGGFIGAIVWVVEQLVK